VRCHGEADAPTCAIRPTPDDVNEFVETAMCGKVVSDDLTSALLQYGLTTRRIGSNY
jgi:hypothetical protein